MGKFSISERVWDATCGIGIVNIDSLLNVFHFAMDECSIMHYDISIAKPDSAECGRHLQWCPICYITIPDSAELNTNIQQCVHIIWTIVQMQCLFQISEVLFGSIWLPTILLKMRTIRDCMHNKSWDTRLSWLWRNSFCLLFACWQQY